MKNEEQTMSALYGAGAPSSHMNTTKNRHSTNVCANTNLFA